jgi:hypothetical protein
MKKKLLLAVFVFFAFANLYAQNFSGGNNRGVQGDEIFLSVFGNNQPALKLITNSSDNKKFNTFFKKYGNWSFLIDRQTGIVHRAFGEGIQLGSLETVNKKNIETFAENFLRENANIFSIDVSSLKLTRVTEVNGHWYVSYKQYYKGLQVVLSEIELRIYKNCKLSNFGMIYYPVKNFNIKPALSPEEIKQFALIGIPFNYTTDAIEVDKDLYILPYNIRGQIEYRLVYKADIKTDNPLKHYFSYVDAGNGKTLWRQNMIMHTNKLMTKGLVRSRFANDTPIVKPFNGQYIMINGSRKKADKNGEVELDLSDTATLNAQFTSEWVRIKLRRGHSSTDYFAKIPPSKDFELMWNDAISHKTERTLFYHANYMHNYVRKLDTSLKQMDFQLQITIDFGGDSPNAFSNGRTIGFIGVGKPTMCMAESPQVLYHEYGHSVNQFIYESQGMANGMLNESCNEGHADLFSTMIQDEPRMGVGVWVDDPSKIIRTLENTLVYPDDLEADGHHNGQILGGAYWDLRKATSLNYVRRLSHFTKYGTPDDSNIGKAFSEWFIETLNTDDDDGDLTNGTPNLVEITKAFNLHHIGTNLFLKYGFEHQQYENTLETEQPYKIDFSIKALPLPNGKPDSVIVYWSTDDFQTVHTVFASLLDRAKGKYQALIPAQPAGSFINYYMHAWDPLSQTAIDFYKTVTCKKPFLFLVGYKTVSLDNFENYDWVSGSSNDKATHGQWENAIPNLVDLSAFGIGKLQPGKDFSEDGMRCWVTGAKGSAMQYYQYMPNGRTTLTSPDLDISSLLKPIIKYQRWFFNIYGLPNPGFEAYWITSISFDEGQTWKRIEKTKTSTDKWEETYIDLNKYLPENAEKVRIRFVVDMHFSSQIISLVEGLIDDFEFLDIDEKFVSVNDNYSDDNFISVYPNPFTEEIYFTVNNRGAIELDIFNLLGREVYSYNTQADGRCVLTWNASNFAGRKLSPGIYFYRVVIDDKILTGKIVLE